MASKADTWMPLYIADYLRKTMHLTRDQHGAYMLLLMACWDRGGRLPNDAGQLAGIAKASPAEWRKLSPVILPFFEVDGAHLIQERVIEEHEKAARLSEIRRQAGSQGGRPKKPNGSENGEQKKPNGLQTETPANVAIPSPITAPPEPPVSDETVSDRASPSGPTKADLDSLWALASQRSRERSSRKDLDRATRAAMRRGATIPLLRAMLTTYFAGPDATKNGGEYAKGVHRLIEADRWLEFTPGPSSSGAQAALPWQSGILAPDESRQRAWMADWVEAPGLWRPGDRGPEPGKPGCRISPDIQREFGVEPARGAA